MTAYPTRTDTSPPGAVPRWAVLAAHLAACTPVLASLWPLPLMFGVSMGMPDAFMADMMSHPFWQRAGYLIGLGALSDGLAYLTLGLVRPWGAVVPCWVPLLRGRNLPAGPVTGVAALGGLAATAAFTVGAVGWPGNVTALNGWTLLMSACYAPLVLWGPLVLAVTWAYYRRRCHGR